MNNPNAIDNLRPNRAGRPKGSQNKSTIERTEAFRAHLQKTNVLFRVIDRIVERLDSETQDISTANLIAIIKVLAPFEVFTANAELISEEIAGIESAEDARRVAEEVKGRLLKLRFAA